VPARADSSLGGPGTALSRVPRPFFTASARDASLDG
jgi:hypothetical protein